MKGAIEGRRCCERIPSRDGWGNGRPVTAQELRRSLRWAERRRAA